MASLEFPASGDVWMMSLHTSRDGEPVSATQPVLMVPTGDGLKLTNAEPITFEVPPTGSLSFAVW